MRFTITAVVVTLGVLVFGTGTALADVETATVPQTAGQLGTSGQSAGAGSGALQSAPTNSAISVRVLSPGDNGSVSQSNTAASGAIAANGNSTSQSLSQNQAGGGPGAGYAQIAGQSAANWQSADARAATVQRDPSNQAIDVRVLSPGNGGNVSQSNTALSGALAANGNTTGQSTSQNQAGGGPGAGYLQVAGQDASSRQSAGAAAGTAQIAPSNQAVGVRVLSPGNDGNVSQSNTAAAGAAALNGNSTSQSTSQNQAGGGPGSGYAQIAGQAASNDQSAGALSGVLQAKPSNEAIDVRVLSPGNGGSVSQSNTAVAGSIAANDNSTSQTIGQNQAGGGYGAGYLQAAGQAAWSSQSAGAGALALQFGASNKSAPVRVGSRGDDGAVRQSNTTAALGVAANGNSTEQGIRQNQVGGGSSAIQAAGQEAKNWQGAGALAVALQLGASNESSPVRVKSPGGSGSVSQSNNVGALAAALNGNETGQSISQNQVGYGSSYLQAAGQSSWNAQQASAFGLAAQLGALSRM